MASKDVDRLQAKAIAKRIDIAARMYAIIEQEMRLAEEADPRLREKRSKWQTMQRSVEKPTEKGVQMPKMLEDESAKEDNTARDAESLTARSEAMRLRAATQREWTSEERAEIQRARVERKEAKAKAKQLKMKRREERQRSSEERSQISQTRIALKEAKSRAKVLKMKQREEQAQAWAKKLNDQKLPVSWTVIAPSPATQKIPAGTELQ